MKPEKANWWEFVKSDEGVYSIQWTWDAVEIDETVLAGAVRARIDSITSWEYLQCGHGGLAYGLGIGIIARQEAAKKRK